MRIRMMPVLCAAAGALALAACSSNSPATVAAPASHSAPAATTAAAPATAAASPTSATTTDTGSSKLTLDLVKQRVVPLFSKDPDCPKGEWVTDVADLDAKYRPAAKEFAYYDCHVADNEAVPHRVAQAVYVSFADAGTANDYADNEAGLQPSLIDGSTVVLIGSGLSTVNVRQTLRDLSQACVCGHVT